VRRVRARVFRETVDVLGMHLFGVIRHSIRSRLPH
jgi:hypothetical protein